MIEKRLIDISRNISSGITPLRSNDEFWTDGTIPWLKTEQLGEKYIFDTNEHITEKALQEANVKIFPENTLSIAMYGEGKTRGNVSILKRSMATNQACCNIELDEEKVSSEYVYYFLKTQYENLRGLSSGIRKNLNTNYIKNFVVRLPENLKTQQSIAAVLSALDKKIALNKQINARLEEIAKTLYDYWFVQFDFPDANGKPYKSSGGEMVFDETLKREIPKGWKPFKLSELVTLSTGKEDANFATEQGIYPFFTCSEKILKCDVYSFDTQAILLAGNGTFSVKRFTGKFNAYQRTYVLEPKSKNLYPIVYFVIIYNVIKFTSGSRGSIIKFITRGDIENIDVVLPNDIENMRFSEVLYTYLLQAELLEKQNHQLTQLRDFLLPMLMNGQVSVAE